MFETSVLGVIHLVAEAKGTLAVHSPSGKLPLHESLLRRVVPKLPIPKAIKRVQTRADRYEEDQQISTQFNRLYISLPRPPHPS